MQLVAIGEYKLADAVCREAVETMKRGCTAEALPRQEALMREGVYTGRAMGTRDFRLPSPILLMEVVSASYWIPPSTKLRLGLLCGSTAKLTDESLTKCTSRHTQRAKASALTWCLNADA